MHNFVAGHWAASTYAGSGRRTDYTLYLAPNGSFRWSMQSPPREALQSRGAWTYDPDEDVLTFRDEGPKHPNRPDQGPEFWAVHYATGCEESNTLLVLRRLLIASGNPPILFYRVHPPDGLFDDEDLEDHTR